MTALTRAPPASPHRLVFALLLLVGMVGAAAQAPAACPEALACAAAGLSCYATPPGAWKYQFTCASASNFFACPAGSATAACANSPAFCSASQPACACNASFTGAFCELPQHTCNNGLQCANGGVCQSAYCSCPPSWIDTSCEQAVLVVAPPGPHSAPPGTVAVPAWVAAPILLGLLLLIGAVGAVVVLVVRERRGRPLFVKLENFSVPAPTRGAALELQSVEC